MGDINQSRTICSDKNSMIIRKTMFPQLIFYEITKIKSDLFFEEVF